MVRNKTLAWVLIAILAVYTGAALLRGTSEGGAKENDDAHVFISALNSELPSIMSGSDRVFYGTRKNLIILEIYDVINRSDQERVLAVIRAQLNGGRLITETIEVSFFPKFLIEKTKTGEGRWTGVVKKTPALRTERIAPD